METELTINRQEALQKAIHTVSRASDESINTLLNRPLADLFVAFFYRFTRISANQVTLLGMAAGILSAIAIAHGTFTSIFIGGLCFQMSAIFDCADGQLARLKGTCSKFGGFLDGISDYVVGISNVTAIIYTSTTYYTVLSPHAFIPCPRDFVAPLIVLGFVSLVIHVLSFDHIKVRISSIVKTGTDQVAKDRMRLTRQSRHRGNHQKRPIIKAVMRFYTGLQERLLPLDAYTKLHYTEQERIAIAAQEKKLLFLWSFLGPNTHIIISIAGALCRDITSVYWLFLIPFNMYHIFLLIYTKRHMATSKELIAS